ncbi:MAG: Transcriptional regulator, MarR family [Actinobacteria bacterium 66_15]|nr:MAG: Transcriptional regulator, MarR family [Actinobacteria bacterium 66_15]
MSETIRERDEREIARGLHAVNEELHKVNLSAWLQLGLPAAQLKALVAIASGDGRSITGLAGELGIGEPAASQVVEQLVRRGYVSRDADPGDRRRVVVTTTEQGSELVSGLRQGRREHVHQWLGSLDDDDVHALARGLGALAQAARNGGAL